MSQAKISNIESVIRPMILLIIKKTSLFMICNEPPAGGQAGAYRCFASLQSAKTSRPSLIKFLIQKKTLTFVRVFGGDGPEITGLLTIRLLFN